MTDCPNGEMRDLLPDLLHERLDMAHRATLEAHLVACTECRAELALLGALRGALRPTTAAGVEHIVGALPAYRAPARRGWGGWRAAAAVLAIAIGGAAIAVATRQAGPERTAGVATMPSRDANEAVPVVSPEPLGQVASRGAVGTARGLPPVVPRELAVEHGLGELSDSELSALLDEIESLDAQPVAEVESPSLVPGNALPSAGGSS